MRAGDRGRRGGRPRRQGRGGAAHVAEARLAAARSDLGALRARMAADDVIYGKAKGDAKSVTEAAAWAEAMHRLDAALFDVAQKESAVAAATNAKSPPPAITAAETALADARAKANAAGGAWKPRRLHTPRSRPSTRRRAPAAGPPSPAG